MNTFNRKLNHLIFESIEEAFRKFPSKGATSSPYTTGTTSGGNKGCKLQIGIC